MNKKERLYCELLWAEEKYLVLSKSQLIYKEIREYLKGEDISKETLKAMIDRAKNLPENRKEVVNALQHIWGYFKKLAQAEEKALFLTLLGEYQQEKTEKDKVLAYLWQLLQKYPNTYLQNSTIFQEEKKKC